MKYYVFIENDNIIGKGQCECSNLKSVEVSKEVYENIDKYIWNGTDVVINQKYDDMIIRQQKEQRIAELKQLLSEADYWGQKYLDGEYTEEEWAEKVAQRKAWREEIRSLENV